MGIKFVVLKEHPSELRPGEFHDRAVRLHEEYARRSRLIGDEKTALLADERAERARERAIGFRRLLAVLEEE